MFKRQDLSSIAKPKGEPEKKNSSRISMVASVILIGVLLASDFWLYANLSQTSDSLERVLESFHASKINRVFPTGRVFLQDDFSEAILHWNSVNIGSPKDASVMQDAMFAFPGRAGSMRITTGTLPLSGKEAFLEIGELPDKRMGAEFWFAVSASAGHILGLFIDFTDGVTRYQAWIQKTADEMWQYKDSQGTWQDMFVYTPQPTLYGWVFWHHLKLKADLASHRFIGDFIVDNKSYSLDGITIASSPYAGKAGVHEPCTIWWANGAGISLSADLHIADVSLTIEEP